jgi:hypothetical protein
VASSFAVLLVTAQCEERIAHAVKTTPYIKYCKIPPLQRRKINGQCAVVERLRENEGLLA